MKIRENIFAVNIKYFLKKIDKCIKWRHFILRDSFKTFFFCV